MTSSTIRYKRTTIKLPYNPRTGLCRVCPDKKLRKTNYHHWRHEFETKEVRKNPMLALKNTAELHYGHHLLANSLRDFVDMPFEILQALVETMDPLTKQNFLERCKQLAS